MLEHENILRIKLYNSQNARTWKYASYKTFNFQFNLYYVETRYVFYSRLVYNSISSIICINLIYCVTFFSV